MWTHSHEQDTVADPQAVWMVLRDIEAWPSWDTSMQAVELCGPFRVGTRVRMTPTGQEPITSVITEVVENERHAVETDLGEVRLGFSHTLVPLAGGGTRIVHRLEITGPAADQAGPQIGPAITADFPEAMAALIARAGG